MVSFAIPPVIIRVYLHSSYRTPKPIFAALELYLRRTVRCCLSYSRFKSFVYSASNGMIVVTGVQF